MAYRKINYTPETLARRKEYQRNYARAKRRTPDGLEYSKQAWAKTNSKLTEAETLELNRQRTMRHRAKKMGACLVEVHKLMAMGCQICGKKQDVSRRRRTMVMDHDHKTGKFRGILCMGCNTGIGKFRDDPEMVKKALLYLLGKG